MTRFSRVLSILALAVIGGVGIWGLAISGAVDPETR
jgi:hypothetical protein